jgi:hypothetical protein
MSENKLFSTLRKESESAGSGSGLIRWLLVAGIVLLVAFNAYKWLTDPSAPAPIPQSSIPGSLDSAKTTDLGQLPTDAASAEEGNEARKLIADAKANGGGNREDLYAKAGHFLTKNKSADAYLIYFYLAKQGYGLASLTLAEMADPAYFKQNISFLDAPDIFQAYKWYNEAKSQGMKEAEAQLRDLKLRAKAAAAGGDEKMRRLLTTW